jgi:hypothetical protein
MRVPDINSTHHVLDWMFHIVDEKEVEEGVAHRVFDEVLLNR